MRPTRRDVAILAAIVAVGRFLYVLDRTAVSLSPDEFASLGIARFLSGGQFNMLVASTYRIGPGLLLTPWTWLFDDPVTVVRLGFATNALIAGATMFVLVPMVGRLTAFGRVGTLLLCGCVGLLPQSLEASAHLWAEPLVTLTFLGALSAVLQFVEQPLSASMIKAAVWSTIGLSSHGRLLPLVVLVSTTLVGWALFKGQRLLAAAAGTLGTLGLAGSLLTHRWLVARVWELPGQSNTTSTVIRKLDKPIEVLDAAAGQLWYQLAASGLLMAFGMVELARRAAGRSGRANQRDALVVLWFTIPMLAVSFVFMSDVGRADHVIYGRYTDAVIWPVLSIGAGWLFIDRLAMSRRRRRFVAGAIVVVFIELGLLVHQLHGHQIRRPGVNAMIGGIVAFSDSGSINALVVTGAGLLVAVVLTLAARGTALDHRLWSLIIVALIATAGVRLWSIQRGDATKPAVGEKARTLLEIDERPPIGSQIGVSLMPNEYGPDIVQIAQLFTVLSYQLYLPEYRFVFDNGPSDDVGPYVFAVENDALLVREGGSILWKHPDVPMALWVEPPRDDDPIGSDG